MCVCIRYINHIKNVIIRETRKRTIGVEEQLEGQIPQITLDNETETQHSQPQRRRILTNEEIQAEIEHDINSCSGSDSD